MGGMVAACGSVSPEHDAGDDVAIDGAIDSVPPDSAVAPGTTVWAQGFGDSGQDVSTSVVVAADGSIVLGGSFEGAVDFGSGSPLVSAGMSDVFVSRRHPDGTYASAVRYGGSDVDGETYLSALAGGNLLLGDTFAGTTDLGNATAAGPSDAQFAVLTAALAPVWSGVASGFYVDGTTATAIDGDGNVLVGGVFAFTASIGDQNPVGDGFDGWLAKFSGSGTFSWDRTIGGGTGTQGPNQGVSSLDTDDAGNVYAGGYFAATATVGADTRTSLGDYDAFLVKYDANGTPLWSKGFGGVGDDRVDAIAVDAGRNVYVASQFQGTASFGGDPVDADPNEAFNTVLAKYDASGAQLWQVVLPVFIYDLDTTGGALHAAGASGIPGVADAVVLRIDPTDGSTRWMKTFGAAGDDFARSIAIAPDGGAIVAGAFSGDVDFGGTPLSSAGAIDAFVVRLAP